MKKILCLFFLLFLLLPIVVGLLLPDRSFSQLENRVLASPPRFASETLLNGRFTDDVETYLADQFPGRDACVVTKVTADYLLGKREQEGVYIGKGRLFEIVRSSKDQLQKNCDALLSLGATLSKRGVNLYLLPAYSAQSFYTHQLPDHAPVLDERALFSSISRQLGSQYRLVDTYKALSAHQDENIYFSTDHHWTQQGAYIAYQQLADAMELPVRNYAASGVTYDFYGSLYSRAPLPWQAPDSFAYYELPDLPITVTYVDTGQTVSTPYQQEALNTKDKYALFLGSNYAEIRIQNPDAPGGRKLLVLKDSFAHALLPFLIQDFQEIIVIDSRYYKGAASELAEREGITDLLVLYNLPRLAEDAYLASLR